MNKRNPSRPDYTIFTVLKKSYVPGDLNLKSSAEINILNLQYHKFENTLAGADPGFSLGGGAQKIMCQHAHYERGTKLTFGRGPGPAKGPGSSGVVLMLSRGIWALFLSILMKNWIKKKHSWSNFRGARACCAPPPPLDPPLPRTRWYIWIWIKISHSWSLLELGVVCEL